MPSGQHISIGFLMVPMGIFVFYQNDLMKKWDEFF
jgi:hypothetical protein